MQGVAAGRTHRQVLPTLGHLSGCLARCCSRVVTCCTSSRHAPCAASASPSPTPSLQRQGGCACLLLSLPTCSASSLFVWSGAAFLEHMVPVESQATSHVSLPSLFLLHRPPSRILTPAAPQGTGSVLATHPDHQDPAACSREAVHAAVLHAQRTAAGPAVVSATPTGGCESASQGEGATRGSGVTVAAPTAAAGDSGQEPSGSGAGAKGAGGASGAGHRLRPLLDKGLLAEGWRGMGLRCGPPPIPFVCDTTLLPPQQYGQVGSRVPTPQPFDCADVPQCFVFALVPGMASIDRGTCQHVEFDRACRAVGSAVSSLGLSLGLNGRSMMLLRCGSTRQDIIG